MGRSGGTAVSARSLVETTTVRAAVTTAVTGPLPQQSAGQCFGGRERSEKQPRPSALAFQILRASRWVGGPGDRLRAEPHPGLPHNPRLITFVSSPCSVPCPLASPTFFLSVFFKQSKIRWRVGTGGALVRALAMVAHWLDPGMEAAVNLCPIPTSVT